MKKLLAFSLPLILLLAITCGCSAANSTPAKSDEPCTTHDFGDWRTATAATCTAGGTEIRTCKNCDEFESRATPMTEHTLVETSGEEPTCERDGSTAGLICENCGYVETAGETIPATGHSYGDWTITTEPTCSAAGSKYRTCSACGKEDTATISALDHSYGSWTTTKEPTCSAEGEKIRTCKNCGSNEKEIIAAADHVFDEWNVVESASCFLPGQEERTCYTCGYSELRPTEPLGAEGHSMDEVERVEPTCEEDGYVVYLCVYCWEEQRETLKATGKHDYDYSTARCKTCGEEMKASSCLKFKLSEDGTYYICTGGCYTSHKVLVIPGTYNGKPVKEVGTGNPNFCWAYNIIILEGVERINADTFYGNINLKSVYLPDSLKYIGAHALSGCDNLEYIEIRTTGWAKYYSNDTFIEWVDLSNPRANPRILSEYRNFSR